MDRAGRLEKQGFSHAVADDTEGPVTTAEHGDPGAERSAPRAQLFAMAHRMTRLVIVVVSVLLALKYLAVALATVGYPYQLEWMEGGVALAVDRVRAGLSLYPAPG